MSLHSPDLQIGPSPLRRATPADVPAIRDLVRAAYAPWASIIGRDPLPMRADYHEAVRRHVVDLHEIDGALAALVEFDPSAGHLLIVNIAVAPVHQRRGIGTALLMHAERYAKERRIPELRLYTNKLMARNIQLYAACGYRIDREEPIMTGIVVHMSKSLFV